MSPLSPLPSTEVPSIPIIRSEEEQQGDGNARAEEVSASVGRVLRSGKVCEAPTSAQVDPHNEASVSAGERRVRWLDMSGFESLVIDTMKPLPKGNISIHNLLKEVKKDSRFQEITEEKFYYFLDQVDKTRIVRPCCKGRNTNLAMKKCQDCLKGNGSRSLQLL